MEIYRVYEVEEQCKDYYFTSMKEAYIYARYLNSSHPYGRYNIYKITINENAKELIEKEIDDTLTRAEQEAAALSLEELQKKLG